MYESELNINFHVRDKVGSGMKVEILRLAVKQQIIALASMWVYYMDQKLNFNKAYPINRHTLISLQLL